jgi:hypothetical protein
MPILDAEQSTERKKKCYKNKQMLIFACPSSIILTK